MSGSFRVGDRVIVKFPNSQQNHIVLRWGTTMDNNPILITKKECKNPTKAISRRGESDNSNTEFQWFCKEYMGNCVWNTLDKVTLKCWEEKI